MHRIPLSLSLALALLASGGFSVAHGQPAQPLSQEYRAAALPVEALDVFRLPAFDNEALLDRDEARASALEPEALQFAEPVDVAFGVSDRGTWEVIEGHRVWRLVVSSPGAFSLNVGFSRFELPDGAALWLYAPGEAPVFRAFTSADHQVHGELWTPIVPGDAMVVELNLPGAAPAADHQLQFGRVAHAYRPFGIPGGDITVGRSGSCNVDVICPEGDDYRDVIRSVATYSRGGSRVCSAVAVNNTSQDGTPYVLTAHHCGMSSGNAASMVVYWNYENSFCRTPNTPGAGGPGDGQLTQFSTGATFRGSGSASDWALVELNQELDAEWEVFLAGWDRRNQATSSAIAIHHPRTQEKRISFEHNPTQITNYLQATPNASGTHIHVIDWNLGTTEPGSSGSPLFSPEKRVVGQLHGGYAACGNNLADWYGRIYHSMNTGLAQWLDPGATGLEYVDGLESGVEFPELPEVAGGTSRAMFLDGSASLTSGPSPFFPREDEVSLSLWAALEGPGTLAELADEDGSAFRVEVVEQEGELYLRYAHDGADGSERARLFDQVAVGGGLRHIAVTRGDEPAAVRVFVDGQRVGQPFFYGGSPPVSAQRVLSVGDAVARGSGVTGLVDEVRLYRSRVPLEALRAGMHASYSVEGAPPSLVAYYRFEADTTGFAFDFSDHGSSGAVVNDSRVASPFPVGEVGALLVSTATSSAELGEDGMGLSGWATSALGGGNQLGLYINPMSEAVVVEEGLPEYVVWRSEAVWGAHVMGEVSAGLAIDFGWVAQQASEDNFRLLHRGAVGEAWLDVTDGWEREGARFSVPETSVFGQWSVGFSPGLSGGGEPVAMPGGYRLEAAYPNPFTRSTTLSLGVADAQTVRAEVFDALGRRVLVLFDGHLEPGAERALVLPGEALPSGAYVVRVVGEGFTVTQRVTLVR